MSHLSVLSDISSKAVTALVEKFNNKKAWLISEIVSLYKTDPLITPEHLLVGMKGISNIGLTYGAWYVNKSGVTADSLNITFIGNHYASIKVMNTPEAMFAEIAAVKSVVDTARKAVDASDASAGIALSNALIELHKEFDKVAKVVPVYSDSAAAMIVLLRGKLEALTARVVAPVKPAVTPAVVAPILV